PLRPREFALLLLASGDAAPRQRARDQQADRAGLGLRRRVLSALVALSPEPEGLEEALHAVVEELGPPTGPTRAIARALVGAWQAASTTPGWVAHLLGAAVQAGAGERGGHGRELP